MICVVYFYSWVVICGLWYMSNFNHLNDYLASEVSKTISSYSPYTAQEKFLEEKQEEVREVPEEYM